MSYEVPSEERDSRLLRKEVAEQRDLIRFTPQPKQNDTYSIGAGSRDTSTGVIKTSLVLNPEIMYESVQISWTGGSGGELQIGHVLKTNIDTLGAGWRGKFLYLVSGDSTAGTGVFEPIWLIPYPTYTPRPEFDNSSTTLINETVSGWTANYTNGSKDMGNIVPYSASLIIDKMEGGDPNINVLHGAKNNGQVTTIKPKEGKTLTLSTGGNIDILSDVTINDNEIAVLQYHEDAGNSWLLLSGGGGGSTNALKTQCRFASTGNNALHPVWNMIIDGATEANEGDRILVKDQSTTADNGIYIVGTVSGVSPLRTATLTRSSDFADSSIQTGSLLVAVQEGSTHLDSLWMLTTNDVITVGTTGLTFTEITSGGGGGLNTNLSNMASPTIPPVDLNLNDNDLIFDASNTQRIISNIGGVGIQVPTGDTIDFFINDLVTPVGGWSETAFNTNVDIDLASGSNILSTFTPTVGNQFRIIFDAHDDSDTFLSNSTTADRISVVSNNVSVLEISPTELLVESTYQFNMNTADIITVGNLDFGAGSADSGRIRLPNSAGAIEWEGSPASAYHTVIEAIVDDLLFTVPDGGNIEFWAGDALKTQIAEFTPTGLDMLFGDITQVDDITMGGGGSIIDMNGGQIIDINELHFDVTSGTAQEIDNSNDGKTLNFLLNGTNYITFNEDTSIGSGSGVLEAFGDGFATLKVVDNDTVNPSNKTMGQIAFDGNDSTTSQITYAQIEGRAVNSGLDTEEGAIEFLMRDGTATNSVQQMVLFEKDLIRGRSQGTLSLGSTSFRLADITTEQFHMERGNNAFLELERFGLPSSPRNVGGINFYDETNTGIGTSMGHIRMVTADHTTDESYIDFEVNRHPSSGGSIVAMRIDGENVNVGLSVPLDMNQNLIRMDGINPSLIPTPPVGERYMFVDSTNNDEVSVKRNDTTVISLETAGAGGEVFTWTNNHDASDFDLLQVDNITSGADNVHNWDISRDATLADDTEIGAIRWRSNDGAGAPVVNDYAYIRGRMEDDVDTNEDGSLFLGVAFAGNHATNFITLNDAGTGEIDILRNVDFNAVTLDNAGIIRSSASDTADTGFIQMGNGEIISWEANPTGDDGLLTFNSLNRFQFSDHPLVPSTNGGTSLGNSGLRWNTVWATNGDITNLLSSTIGASNTLSAPVVSSGLSYTDGIKQTFNPNATNAGINVGSHTADPSSPSAGDIYYDSTNHKFRIATGASPTWGDLGGGGEVFTWTNHHDADGYNFLISQSGLSRIFGDRDAAIPAGEIWFQVDNGASGSNTILVMDHGASEVRIGTGYNLNPTSSGTQQLGIDSDRWDSVWVDSYIDMDDSGTPTNAGSGEGRLYWNNTTKSFHQVDDVGTTTDLSSASAGANQQLSNLSGTVAVNQSIQSDTNITDSLGTSSIGWLQTWSSQLNFVAGSGTPVGNYGSGLVGTVVKHNVPTGGSWQFDIQGSNKVLLNNSKMEFKSLDLDMNNNEIDDINFIRFMGSSGDVSFGKIGVVSGATDWLELIGDSTSSGVRIKATNATPTESTVAEFLSGQLDMLGNNIVDVSILNFEAVTGGDEPQIYSITDDLVLQVTTGDTHRLNVGGTDEYTFDASTADWNSNEITDMGGINFASVGTPQASAPEIVSQSDDLYFGVPTGNKFIFEVNQSSEYEFSSTFFYLRDNYMRLDELGSAPPANANAVKIWCEDNGSGKTRLMCRFGTGASQQIAIEP